MVVWRHHQTRSEAAWPPEPGAQTLAVRARFSRRHLSGDYNLRTVLSCFGIPAVHYVYELVAAAYWFAQSPSRDATVLVADLGGGTTDCSLIRFERYAGQLRAVPISHSVVGIAGDHFSHRMIDNLVTPEIGKGSRFRRFDN